MRAIGVSHHAVTRHAERFSELALNHDSRRDLIARTVDEALDEGRHSLREPRWLHDERRLKVGLRNGRERDRTLRWCWDEAREFVALVDKRSSRLFIVVTCLRAEQPARVTTCWPSSVPANA